VYVICLFTIFRRQRVHQTFPNGHTNHGWKWIDWNTWRSSIKLSKWVTITVTIIPPIRLRWTNEACIVCKISLIQTKRDIYF